MMRRTKILFRIVLLFTIGLFANMYCKEIDFFKVKRIIIGCGRISAFERKTAHSVDPLLINNLLNNTKSEIILPDDVLVKYDNDYKCLDINNLSEIDSIVDIGPKSINKYKYQQK